MYWSNAPRYSLGLFGYVLSFTLLLLPTGVLGALAYRLDALPLAVGAGVQVLFTLVFLRHHPVWRPPVSALVIVLYIIALVWAYVPTRDTTDWVVHVGQGIILLGAVGLIALHDLTRTGAEPLRPGEPVVAADYGPAPLAAATDRLPHAARGERPAERHRRRARSGTGVAFGPSTAGAGGRARGAGVSAEVAAR